MKELDSYLNDHLAGSVGALELIAHWKHLYEDKPLGAFFTGIEAEIRADQDTLRDLMRSLGIERKLQCRAEEQIELTEAERIRAARRALESPTG